MIEVYATSVLMDCLEPLVEDLNNIPRDSIPDVFMGMANSNLIHDSGDAFHFSSFEPHFCSCLAGRLNELNVGGGDWLDVDFFNSCELKIDAFDSAISDSFSSEGWKFFDEGGVEYPTAKSHLL